EEPTHKDTPINHDVFHPSHNLVTGDPGSAQSSSGNVNSAEPNQVNYPPDHRRRWTKDNPLDRIYKVKLDEYGDVLKNKARLVAKGYHLKKALYGLKQAPRAWYDTLSKFLLANNFFKDAVDPTLFTRKSGKHILLV
ncbi:retrovirus-related pol polyprotein from transposon TNT 1-94, partial [Tanacetum coccineum]